MTAWKTCRLIRLTHCSSRVVTPRHPGFSPRRRVAFENDRHQDISNSSQNRVVNRLPMLAGGAVGVVGGVEEMQLGRAEVLRNFDGILAGEAGIAEALASTIRDK